jgi:hypothetical protein
MTRERQMRGGDRSFAQLLLVEGLERDAVAAAAGAFAPAGQPVPLYAQVFSLGKAELPQ